MSEYPPWRTWVAFVSSVSTSSNVLITPIARPHKNSSNEVDFFMQPTKYEQYLSKTQEVLLKVTHWMQKSSPTKNFKVKMGPCGTTCHTYPALPRNSLMPLALTGMNKWDGGYLTWPPQVRSGGALARRKPPSLRSEKHSRTLIAEQLFARIN